MTEGATRQGRMVSDLNADTQIGAAGWIEIVFISLVRARAAVVPRCVNSVEVLVVEALIAQRWQNSTVLTYSENGAASQSWNGISIL